MSEERNYQYDLYLKEKECIELRKYIKELEEIREEYYQKEYIKNLKEDHSFFSFRLSFVISFFAMFVPRLLLRVSFLSNLANAIDAAAYFFGFAFPLYHFIFHLRTRKIGKKNKE